MKFFTDYLTYIVKLLDRYQNYISEKNRPEISVTPIILEKFNKLRNRFVILQSIEGLTEPDQIQRNIASFRTLLMELEILESFGLPIITHYQKEFDGHLTSILNRICEEVGCPVNTPHVCALSTGIASRGSDYYWYHPSFETIFVPAAERFSLLNLPDVLHELGHHILMTYRDSFLEPFSKWFSECNSQLERELFIQGVGDQNRIRESKEIFSTRWPSFWAEEIICDMIAAYCTGEAFAWTNLKLCQSYPPDRPDALFSYSETHPPDAYRMDAILTMLKQIRIDDIEIQNTWAVYITIAGPGKPALYDIYFPMVLINKMTKHVCNICGDIGLISCTKNNSRNDSIIAKLNQAWLMFRKDMDSLFEMEGF